MNELNIQVDDEGERIDAFIAKHVENVSRAYAQKLIQNSNILINNRQIKANYKLKVGDQIQITIPAPEPLETKPEDIAIEICYEDEQILIVDKPKGMVVHPAAGNYTGTLVNALLAHCGDRLSSINGVARPGIVHRIDKDTSGILLITKTNFAHEYFSDLFKRHDIKRVYYAIVEGVISENKATIDAPLGRHPVDRKKMSVNLRNGKHAVTHIEILKRFKKNTYIKAELETGRTHQIRVHLAYIKHPLVGDTVYGNKKQEFMLDGQALHAGILGFVHPVSKEYMEFSSKPPKSFLDLLNHLRS